MDVDQQSRILNQSLVLHSRMASLVFTRKLPVIFLVLITVVSSPCNAGVEQCASYTPMTCLFGDVDIRKSHCHPSPCNFDLRGEMPCVFPESGIFKYTDPNVEVDGTMMCRDPFMSTVRHGPRSCGTRCCRPDHDGNFVNIGPLKGRQTDRYEYQPKDSSCRYEEIGRGQVLHYLHSRGSPVAVMGDSMMRQFFLRLVMMIRGQKRLIDYHQHSHAQYSVCREADMFRISTSIANESSVLPNDGHLLAKIPSFFQATSGPGTFMAHKAMSKCSRAPVQIHYMHVPRFVNQVRSVPAYLSSLPLGVKPVLLLSVGYWQKGTEVPEDYLQILKDAAPKSRKIFIVSVPTVRVVSEEKTEDYRARNAFMKSWVAEQGEPFAYLDYDTISSAKDSPPGGADNNWHYMCSLAWRLSCTYCDLVRIDHHDGVDTFGEPIPQFPVGNLERIMSTEDGSCADEMNRNLWQVVFNTLITPYPSASE